eukprot:TRINITY_DN11958_c0_g2_i2.p2 TRINITY_DN11958_c0_g2~~TRINITY_DN11958_c0_g2_i2.p2  ORF type:complete len:505 (+),score=67.28 TRINITY_DN11958_c0_g2_i2:1946-3460(+)
MCSHGRDGLHFNLGDHEQTLAGIYTSYFKGERHESIKTMDVNVSSFQSTYHKVGSHVLTTAALESEASIRKTFPNLSHKAISALDTLGSSHSERLQSLGTKSLHFSSTVAVKVSADYLPGQIPFIAALLGCIPVSSSVHLQLSCTTIDPTCANLPLLTRAIGRLRVEKVTLSNSSLMGGTEIPAAILTPTLRSLEILQHDAKGKLSLDQCTHLQELRIEAATTDAGVITAPGLNQLYIGALCCKAKVKFDVRPEKHPWVELHGAPQQKPLLHRDHLLISSLNRACNRSLEGTFRWFSLGFMEMSKEPRVDTTILRCFLWRKFHTKPACKGVMLHTDATMPTDVESIFSDPDLGQRLAKRFPDAFFKVVKIRAVEQDDFAYFPTPSPIVIINHSHRFIVDDYGTLLMTWYKEDVMLSGLLPLLPLLIALRVRGVSIGDANIARIMVQLAAGAGITPKQACEKAFLWASDDLKYDSYDEWKHGRHQRHNYMYSDDDEYEDDGYGFY